MLAKFPATAETVRVLALQSFVEAAVVTLMLVLVRANDRELPVETVVGLVEVALVPLSAVLAVLQVIFRAKSQASTDLAGCLATVGIGLLWR